MMYSLVLKEKNNVETKLDLQANESRKMNDSFFSITEKEKGGVQAFFVTACAKEALDGDEALTIHIEESCDAFMAIRSHSRAWSSPVFGSRTLELPDRVQSLLLKKEDRYTYYLPVCDSVYKTEITGTENGLKLVMHSACEKYNKIDNQLAFVYAKGDDPHILMEKCATLATELLGGKIKMREERRYPEVFEYLGWCSWDALQIRVSEEGLLEKAAEFKEKGVPVRFAIIDDMWANVPGLNDVPKDIAFGDMVRIMHESPLRDFEGDPVRFPHGMKSAVSKLKSAGIDFVGIWFPVTGYWRGLEKSGNAASELSHVTITTQDGKIIVSPEKEKANTYFNYLCNKAKGFGADFVKIDNQGIHGYYKNIEAVGISASNIHNAIENATAETFDSALINCMGMPSECLFNRSDSAVCRCSDDFIPESSEWFAKNILQCAFNGTLQGRYHVNDWDMWWTDDEQAIKNSLCRSVSGGPVYISDKIGRTRPEILKPLIFDDGRILRCDKSADPTTDCLVSDPRTSGKILKVRNKKGKSSVVAVFNIDKENKPVMGSLCPKESDVEKAEEYIVFEYFTKECFLLKSGDKINITLRHNDDIRLYTIIPREEGITPIGRTDKFISYAAITEWNDNSIILYEGGEFSFVFDGEIRVFAENRELEIRKNGILSTVFPHKNEKNLKFIYSES